MNFLIVYDKNYSQYAPNCVNAVKSHHPKAKIHAIVSSDVTSRIGGVKYYVHDNNRPNCIFKGCRINSNIVYNYLEAPRLIKEKRCILLGIDTIINGDVTDLWKHKTGACGIAARVNPSKRTKTLKEFMFLFADKHPKLTKEFTPFCNASMVMDLDIMRKRNFTKWANELLDEYHMSEMAVFNLYSNGDYEKLDKKWMYSANYNNASTSAIIYDWHGKKPWSGAKNSNIWSKYA
jgi:lipopolysaccharide biosynthesis glycosyltransferase